MSSDAARQPQSKRYADRRPEGPRRVRHGIKLQGVIDFPTLKLQPQLSEAAAGQQGSIGIRWYATITRGVDDSVLGQGFEYARAGQVVALEFEAGIVRASVQGTAARPYQVQIRVPTFDQGQWHRIIDAMSAEAVYSAKMLTGELPPGINELLASFNLQLLPEHSSELNMSCTCELNQPCKHVITAAMIAAERLHEHPLLILTLLGMPADQLLERLRRARAIQTKGAASAHGDALIPETQIEPPPLEACLDDFWHGSRDVAELTDQSPPSHAPHALLRRLGPSPLKGKFPMVGLLASVYDTVAQAARKLADEGVSDEGLQQ